MTNEEAITRLKGLYGNDYKEQEQALDMAIRALKNEQSQVEKQVKDLDEMGKWFLDGVIEGFNEQTEQNVGMCQQNVGEMSEKQTDEDLISRDFMKKLGATCIAKRSETGELVAISSIDNLSSAEKTTLSTEKTTITDCGARMKGVENE